MRWVGQAVRFDESKPVAADGTLTIQFGPNRGEVWDVSQVSLEMPDAPAGAIAELRDVMGALMSPAYSARRASASGSQYLNPGDRLTVSWTGCTPGDVGRVFASYRKGVL